VTVVLPAARAMRRLLPYELWHFLHLSSYAILFLAYGHQFANGEQLVTGWGRLYWTGLYFVVIGCLATGRLLDPIWLNLKHRLRVDRVEWEGHDVSSLYITGRRLDELDAKAGQFFRWRFLAPGLWWQAHPFSLSAAPDGRQLRLTIKVVGHYTARLRWLRRGARVYVEGPSGVFTVDWTTGNKTLLIAGGIGITPIRALLEELPAGAIVIYRVSTADDLVFRDELNLLARVRGADILYEVGSRHQSRADGVLTEHGLSRLVPDVARRDVYLCGPAGFVDATVQTLRRLHVPDSQLHLDPFEF
jgi:predicted ferric reductase